MKKKFSLVEGEILISNLKPSNYSNGKLNILSAIFTLGIFRKGIQTGWVAFSNKRVVFCKHHWFKNLIFGTLTSLFPSKRILWEINIEDIESISSYRCLSIYPIQRIHSKRFEGEKFDFGFGNEKMIEICEKLVLRHN